LKTRSYQLYVICPSWQRYAALIVLFALGLMTKPMLVTLPFALLLLDYWPMGRLAFGRASGGSPTASLRPASALSLLSLIGEKLPLFALALGACVITVVAQRQGSALIGTEQLPLASRGINAVVAYTSYLRQTLLPVDLAPYYPLEKLSPLDPRLAVAAVQILCISPVVFWERRRHLYLVSGWLWYLGTLVPVIGIVQVGTQAIADRYTYVPLIGVFMMLAFGAAELIKHCRISSSIAGALVAAVLAGCTIMTHNQVGYWRDSLSLWRHTVEVVRPNPITYGNLGNDLLTGRQYQVAREWYEKALEVDLQDKVARYGLGVTLMNLGENDQAGDAFRQLLRICPDHSDAHYQLDLLLLRQGQLTPNQKTNARKEEHER
jgi:tetratricopeptide (TPR) repeat protein